MNATPTDFFLEHFSCLCIVKIKVPYSFPFMYLEVCQRYPTERSKVRIVATS